MDSSRYDIYIYDYTIPGPKPEISIEQRNELLEKGKDSVCKITLPDINFGNGYFCQIIYNENKYNVLIINNQIINRETLKTQDYLNIKYNYNYNTSLISIKNKILDINSENKKYNFIEINNNEFNFYNIEGNFNGDFNEEIKNKIIKEGNKYICDILLTIVGTGFICQIPYNNNNINVLFTNNHIINKDLLLKGKKIRYIYKGNLKEIEITENRLVWTDLKNYKVGLDYTCIQIFDEDGFDTKNIFQIEESNLSNYNGLDICVLQYPKSQIELTTGYIQNLNKYEIFHNADTEYGSSGSPIICINNHKVIGIHRCTRKNGKTNNILNFGSFIKYILKKY